MLSIPFCPQDPTKNPKQAQFLLTFNLEALYGGAVGGGKSSALLMGGLQFVAVPGYSALILRRTYKELSIPGALLSRARQWFGGQPGARWNGISNAWEFATADPRRPASITFGYLEHEDDQDRYKSAEFQYIGIDELTELEEADYRFLFSRLRRPHIDEDPILGRVPLRIRGGTNPGGRGHEWVKRRFVKPGRPDRVYVPATLDDMVGILDVSGYEPGLAEMTALQYARMRHGDWDAQQEGALFKREHFVDRIIPEVPEPVRGRVRYWDLAATEVKPGKDPDWTAGARCSVGVSGRWYIEHVVRFRKDPGAVEDHMKLIGQSEPSLPVRIEQEGGASGKLVIRDFVTRVFPGFNVKGLRSTGSKVERAKPMVAQAEHRNIYLVEGDWIPDFLDEAEAFQPFPTGNRHDDQIDACSGAFGALTGASQAHASSAVGGVLPRVRR